MILRLAALGLGVAFLTACSSNDSPLAQQSAAIVLGEPEAARPEVVAIGVRRSRCAEPFAAFCSGTLIAPDVVLSAAHCFDEKRPDSIYEVWFAANAQQEGGARYVDALALHPSFDADTHVADLALLHLSEPVTDVTPARLSLTNEPSAGTAPGALVEIVGYGADVTGRGPPVKQRGTARIATVAPENFRILPDPALTCHGDSGGPAFASDADGGKLVGVTSFGDLGCQEFGVQIRPGAYWADFIAPFLAATRPAQPSLAAAGDLCVAPCASADDCPSGFECVLTSEGSRCVASATAFGNYEGTCRKDADCGSGYCGRIRAQTADNACACLRACASPPRGPSSPPNRAAPDEDSSSGCALSRSMPDRMPAAWLSLALFWIRARARYRRGQRE